MSSSIKITGISSIILLLILLTTDPKNLPSTVLIVPFLLLFIGLVSASSYLLGVIGVGKKSRLKFSLMVGAVPVVLLVLQSLGQLTLRDGLVIFAFFAVAYMYISRLGTRPVS
jgi:hypothetical protein